jgi:hypothetical protein
MEHLCFNRCLNMYVSGFHMKSVTPRTINFQKFSINYKSRNGKYKISLPEFNHSSSGIVLKRCLESLEQKSAS